MKTKTQKEIQSEEIPVPIIGTIDSKTGKVMFYKDTLQGFVKWLEDEERQNWEIKRYVGDLLEAERLRRRKEKSEVAKVNYESAKWEERKKIIENLEGIKAMDRKMLSIDELINIIKTT